jgi:pimeloyl-ACP methyl ester carboxylesterase
VKQLAPTHRVHVLQVKGFAGEPAGANAEGPVLAPLIEEVAAYTEKLDKPAIIGHSLGGLVGIEVAARKPDAVSRLMIVDALPFYALLFNPAATAEMVRPQAEMTRTQITAQSQAQFAQAQAATARMLVRSQASQPVVLDWSLKSDRTVLAQALYDDMLADARPLLPKIKARTTVLYAFDAGMGRPAAMVDGMYASAYAGLSGAQLKRIDGSFHFIMMDQPEAFAREVAAFLQ